jgi:hypothetical protein
VAYSRPGIHVKENFAAVLEAGLDEVRKREYVRPEQGAQFFRVQPMKKAGHKFLGHYGLGVVSQNRDSEDLPYDEMGLGFDWELTVNTFRGAIKVEKELLEDELYGVIADRQQELIKSEKLARELVMADWFNRCLGTSGAPGLCEDGMYFIDSARPNAYKEAGTWSNLGDASALTPAKMFTEQLQFAYNRDERGQKAPLKMRGIVIRPQDEVSVWEILKSDLRPTDSMNAKNFQMGRFEYKVYDHLTSAVALYYADDFKSSANELLFGERVAAQVETWTSNGGDVTHQRIRSRFGVGCGRPHMWRGHTVS